MLHGQYDGSLLNGDSLRPVARLRLCKHARVKIYTLNSWHITSEIVWLLMKYPKGCFDLCM